MILTSGDLSLFFKLLHNKLIGLPGAYVDETIGRGGMGFESESKMRGENFQSEPRENDQFPFSAINIEKLEGDVGYLMH